jgi:hypothetical protein
MGDGDVTQNNSKSPNIRWVVRYPKAGKIDDRIDGWAF